MKTLCQGTRSGAEIPESVFFQSATQLRILVIIKLSSAGSIFEVLRYSLSYMNIFSHVIGSNQIVQRAWNLNYKNIIMCSSLAFLINLFAYFFNGLQFNNSYIIFVYYRQTQQH